jgi:membrane-associated phospholipid phosphatase
MKVSGFLYFVAVICQWRKIKYIGIACELLASGIVLTIPVLISTYLAMSLNYPLADNQLIAMDNALGFDWHWLIALVNSNALLEDVLARSYTSFSYQLLAVPVLLVALGNQARACAFVMGYGILCYISSFLAIWYPALGTYVMYGVSQADVPNIRAFFGFFFLNDFNAVRESAGFILKLDGAAGIITYPSVHAGVACLIIWAMWENRYTRIPFLLLNLSMCLSAVSHANHYLVDVIAGAGIAGLTASIVTWLFLPLREIGTIQTKSALSHAG